MVASKFIKPYVEHGEKASAVRKITVSIPMHVLRLLSDLRTYRQVNNLRHATNSDLLVEAFLHAFTGQPLPTDEELRRTMATAKKKTVRKSAKKAAKKSTRKAAAKRPVAKKATAKKRTVRKTAKKAGAKRVGAKKATAKRVGAKKAAKKATRKRTAKKAAAAKVVKATKAAKATKK